MQATSPSSYSARDSATWESDNATLSLQIHASTAKFPRHITHCIMKVGKTYTTGPDVVEPSRQATPYHVHGCAIVIQPVLIVHDPPPVATKTSLSADSSAASAQPLGRAVALAMQLPDHVDEFAGNTPASCDGTEPVS